MIEPMTLARPYARAAFDFADGAQALGAWATALSQLATIAGDVTAEKLLKDPAKTASARADAVTTLIDGDVPMGLKNFLHIASDHGRLALLPEMAQQFTELKAAREATVEVEVISAFAVSEAETQKLADAMAKQLSRSVSITTKTDPALVGGAVIRAGDLVIDGSVRGRLNKLANALKP